MQRLVLLAALLCLSGTAVAARVRGTAPGSFERIFIIQFENQPEYKVISDPNFAKYAAMGTYLTNYSAITHPSQPNYWSQGTGIQLVQ